MAHDFGLLGFRGKDMAVTNGPDHNYPYHYEEDLQCMSQGMA